mgnify:CR=1 FL=1
MIKLKDIHYYFKDKSLFERAMTHASKSSENYERLEFLGDSILDFLVGEYFFFNCKEDEGKLTVLRSHYVSENYLSHLFDLLQLTEDVKMGKSYQGEISKAIKGDVVEALIAAIYLDGGIEEARNFIYRFFELDKFKEIIDDNYKSKLQELIQGNFKCKMNYDTYAFESGFVSDFYMDEDLVSSGEGKSKQEAEQSAAKKAIDKLFLLN